LRAKELFKSDVDYVVQSGEVKIVDEFTGRILEGRRGPKVSTRRRSEGAGEDQRGEPDPRHDHAPELLPHVRQAQRHDQATASTEAGEFAHTYGLEVVSIPTNQAMIRIDEPDLIYKTEAAKFEAAADDIAERARRGQPVLVGTISVENPNRCRGSSRSGASSTGLLNAKQHEREAHVVTQAGRLGAVTVATNMAGRGVDILLGGNPRASPSRSCSPAAPRSRSSRRSTRSWSSS